MKNNIKIAFIGATGKSGMYLLQELLKQNYALKLLIRHPEKLTIQTPLIEIIQGDVRDATVVKELVSDCQAVMSTLGQPKGETQSVFSQASQNVIKAMQSQSIERYIVTTGLHIDTPDDQKSPQTKFATDWMRENYAEISKDKQVEYEILAKSDLLWTLVRLPLIKQTTNRSEILESLEDCPGNQISATNLADFLIRQLSDELYIQQAPFIADKIIKD